MGEFRWRQLAGSEDGLFEPTRRVVGRGEYRGLTFHEIEARSIINEAPPGTPWFRYTINAYRGCSHACVYCLAGDTPILMADGRSKPIRAVRPGDRVYGTRRVGAFRRFVEAEVLDSWSTIKPAYRITAGRDTVLIASADHRFLTDRGWKHVAGPEQGRDRRPHLTCDSRLVGFDRTAVSPKEDDDYRQGYLSGLIRGLGTNGTHPRLRPGKDRSPVQRFRLALVDREAGERARRYLLQSGVTTTESVSAPGDDSRRPGWAIRTSSRAGADRIRQIMQWPEAPSENWALGFLAGVFDAAGSHSKGVLRISNSDQAILDQITAQLDNFGFDAIQEKVAIPARVASVRIRGGMSEHLRFFLLVDPAVSRKRSLLGAPLKIRGRLDVTGITALGIDVPMFDLTTTTGDFVANGVISHNCFARPTHEYLGLDTGEGFDTQIVVKVNAVDLLKAELAPGRWSGETIAMGTNTDPYQAAEGKYRLTRGIIQVLAERANPFSILTKSPLVLRDLDLIAEAARTAEVSVGFSVGTVDEDVWRRTEPGAPHPRKRLEALGKLRQAGIRGGVMMAPLLPGISDRPDQVAAVRRAAAEMGAEWCHPVKLHLRGVRSHFLSWLESDSPGLVSAYLQRYPERQPRRAPPPLSAKNEADSNQLRLSI
ncbi:MAG TPA: radical SAM protein [Acidimicrobiia bacterium]|nr:radical SAM protein [Acidimicrobiia bacterium]